MPKIDTESSERQEVKGFEYPITVNDIKFGSDKDILSKLPDAAKGDMVGSPVSVRLVGDGPPKTYFGIYLGHLPSELSNGVMYDPSKKILILSQRTNPAIFIPELKKVVRGYESWWGFINSEEELREITDKDIENTWYVKLAKEMVSERP